MKFALLPIALATAQLVAAQRVAIRVPPDETEQYYLVSFDRSRASVKDVERWMKFAENGYYYAGVSLSGCDKSAATRMREDLESTRQISDQLDSETYPPQLSAVVAYLRRQLRLQLCLGEQEIQFAETGALPQTDAYGVSACRANAKRASRERGKRRMFGDRKLDELHSYVECSSAWALSERAVQSLSKCKGHSNSEMRGNHRLTFAFI